MRTEYYSEGRALTINRVQDVEPIIEDNKRLQLEPQSRKSSFRHIARVPAIILEKWFNEELARGNVSLKWGSKEFDGIIAKKLRDPDWAFLRTDRKQAFGI